jgi:hypothetical protein
MVHRSQRTHAAGSTSPIAAKTITAPSTAFGRYCTGSVRNSKMRSTVMAAMRPATWLRAPMPSFTAVLRRLEGR